MTPRYASATAALAAALALVPTVRAQQAPPEVVPTGALPITLHLCELPAVYRADVPGGAHDHTFPVDLGLPPTATFQVTYNGFSPEAQAAFQYAVDIWAQHIASAVPIKVQANWTPLGSGVLGSAGSNGLFANFAGAPVPGTWYANALADALSGTPIDPSGQPNAVELTANFNSAFSSWYFGTDGNTPSNLWDFVTVVFHELGHGLGFFGRANVDDGNGANGNECSGVAGDGCLGVIGVPVIWDRFVEDVGGEAAFGPTYPNPGPQLGTLLRSNNLFWDGLSVVAALGGRAKLYAPGGWQPGSSYSHLDEGTYNGTPNALMTPQVANGEVRHSPGPATCALFRDMGWPMGPGCEAIIPPVANEPEATADAAYALAFAGPNPAAGRTAFRLTARDAQTVRAEVVDVTGRAVATLHDGAVAAGQPVELAVDAGALAAGVYVVRVAGERFTATERFVVAR